MRRARDQTGCRTAFWMSHLARARARPTLLPPTYVCCAFTNASRSSAHPTPTPHTLHTHTCTHTHTEPLPMVAAAGISALRVACARLVFTRPRWVLPGFAVGAGERQRAQKARGGAAPAHHPTTGSCAVRGPILPLPTLCTTAAAAAYIGVHRRVPARATRARSAAGRPGQHV